ncbi:kinase-like protein [Neolentinus lepideus HHB14362 ss-1]|uniref:Kinase-like protein n=1 Tax=Neolentinus lepideus HHB14362 ss-1 TaxID=1314782 RepID=A0A165QZX2_9AGAM|nr:kinase-like protein [Neolentinus lepideus HHB14362 ss-1]
MADGSLPQDSPASMDGHTPLDPEDGVRMTGNIRERYTDSGLPVINQYIRGPMVGKGQHGDVYLAWDLLNDRQPVAIKAVRRKNPRAEKMKKLRRPSNIPSSPHLPLTERLSSTEQKIRKEIAIMKKLRHAHIVRLLEVIDDKLYSRIFMVMEFLGGGEVKWRNRNGRPVLRVDQSRRIIRDVILGLEYLHYQGIIHRDIKPANLMYTSDRRTVKITDFGVSHFSYAQRLASAGQRNLSVTGDSTDDPVLMDESDLSRTAGTPAFMAPEVIYDIGTMSADGATSVTPLTPPKRAISKAIDVWALGVTLYCLLFGTTPFFDEDMNEYPVYQMICNQDWDLPPTMGSDQVESGPRHAPRTKHDTQGNVVVRLLERLLEKDAEKRITLEQVKRCSWFLRDIPNADAWLRETSPSNEEQVRVTDDDASDAMSDVRFRWTRRLTRPISYLWKTVRTQRSFRSKQDDDEEELNRVGLRSAPHVLVGRAKTVSARPSTSAGPHKTRRLAPIVPEYNNQSSPDVVSHIRSRSIERYPTTRHQSVQIAGSFGKARRGSETLLVPRSRNVVPASPQSGYSAHSASPTSSSLGDQDSPYSEKKPVEEPSRNRFSLSSWIPAGLRASRNTTYNGPAPHEASTSASLPVSSSPSPRAAHRGTRSPVADLYARRSEEAFAVRQKNTSERVSESLTAARRASSWGETADYARHSEDVTSIHSADQWETSGVDKEVMNLGAGGVLLNEPIHPAASAIRLVTPGVPQPLTPIHPQTERVFCEAADPVPHDLIRQVQAHPRSRTTSPLTQEVYSLNDRYQDYEDDSSSFFDRNSDDDERPPLNTSQLYNEEDDESDDDAIPLEVRRRRPSVSVTLASPPPDSSEE